MISDSDRVDPRQIVQPKSTGKVPLLLCLLLAGLSSFTVYRWGYGHWWPVRAKPTYTATVYVVDRPAETATVGTGKRVPLTSTDADPQRARAAAEAMADSYISTRQDEWRNHMEQPLTEASGRVAEAQQRRQQCIDRLEAFKRDMHDASAAKETVKTDSPHPKMITNPQWLALERQSMKLINRREELLATRTSRHPSVMEVSDKIVEIERKMANTPREIPYAQEKVEQDASMTAAAEAQARENERRLAELDAAVAEAEKSLRQAESVERNALERLQSTPDYTVEQARIVENPPASDYRWWRLIYTTLGVGLMMAFGAGSLSFGASIEPPVATAAEVRNVTGKTVVGAIPPDEAAADELEIGRQWGVRRTTIALGILLMLTCPVAAVWGVLGIS